MKLDPDTILTKTFTRKVMGGYSTAEVADFLEKLAGEIEEQNKKQEELAGLLKEKETFIREYRDREGMLKNTITTAQNMAEKIKKDAEKEAEFIMEDARHKAQLVVREARDSLKTSYQELADLKRVHIQLKNSLKSVLQSHQDLLDQHNLDKTLEGAPGLKEKDFLIDQKMNESLNQAAAAKEYL